MKLIFRKKEITSLSQEGGYSLLFAVLIASMLLAIGASMANLAIKETNLIATARQSQAAFYAADTGIECALFYDLQGSPYFKKPYGYNANAINIQCNGVSIPVAFTAPVSNGVDNRVVNSFNFDFNGACVYVTVTKIDVISDDWDGMVNGVLVAPEPDDYNGTGKIGTIIDARGRNNSCSALTNAIHVERALKVEY